MIRSVLIAMAAACAGGALAAAPHAEAPVPVEVGAAEDEPGAILDDRGVLGSVITNAPVLSTNATAAEVLAACRAMLPRRPLTLVGALILRNRKGIPMGEYGYRLRMDRSREPARLEAALTPEGKTNVLERVTITRRGAKAPVIEATEMTGAKSRPDLIGRVMDTDVTWLDLTLDFLWWPTPAYEAERELESVHGQKCVVILVAPPAPIPGVSAVRLWADRKTGCLMQAEQLDAGLQPIRRLWGTRVKKFNGRWMANVLEVETLGSGHRTKIVVEDVIEE